MDRDLIQARRAVRRNRCCAAPDRFPRPSTGYPSGMSDADSTTEPGTKPGPASPQAEGADAPTPPGGPQRQDAAGPGLVGDDEGVGAKAADSVEDEHAGTMPIDQEQAGGSSDDQEPTGREAAQQEENAETSLDQPSQ